jgi:hypothetical protein
MAAYIAGLNTISPYITSTDKNAGYPSHSQ